MVEFGIWTEYSPTVGLGHAVRCRHLKRELERRGHSVEWNQSGWLNVVDYDDTSKWLGKRNLPKRVVQIVGAAQQTLTNAELRIYQTGWRMPRVEIPSLSGDMRSWSDLAALVEIPNLSGPDYLLLSPAYQKNGAAFPRRKDVLVQFGAGFPWGLSLAVATDLSRMGFRGTIVRAPYHEARYPVIRGFSYAIEPTSLWGLHSSHCYLAGSLGMSTYEAVAAGCFPVVTGRTEDHLQTAFKLYEMGWCIAVGPMDVALGIDAANGLHRLSPRGVIDGRGVERVADALERLL